MTAHIEGFWTAAEDNFLIENLEDMKIKEIAKHLNRTEKSVRARKSRLQIIDNKKVWNDKDDSFLADNRNHMTNKEIASCLNRAPSAIKYRLKQLNLKRSERTCMCPKDVDQTTYKYFILMMSKLQRACEDKNKKIDLNLDFLRKYYQCLREKPLYM